MKTINAILAMTAAAAVAETTIYGATGLQFVPTGGIAETQGMGMSVAGSLDSDPSTHVALRSAWLDNRLEVALSNTWTLVASDSNGFRARNTGVFPVVPSLKYVLDHNGNDWQDWSYAIGLSMPYGAYGAVTWRLNLPVLSPSLTAGMGTPVKTFHVFGGAQLDLCDLDRKRLPVSILADAAYGGSTKTIGESAEAFWSLGVSTRIGRNLTFRTFHRRDRGYAAPANRQNRDGTSYLQLAWNFDGVKSAPQNLEKKP